MDSTGEAWEEKKMLEHKRWWQFYNPPRHKYRRIAGQRAVASFHATVKRRAKNKQARKSRKANRV